MTSNPRRSTGAKQTPGPWEAHPTVSAVGFGYVKSEAGWLAEIEAASEEEVLADARLIAAAPAYAVVWSMVPDEIRQRIFDALHKPDTEWVEASIAKAEGGDE